jgi:hypothetical protein
VPYFAKLQEIAPSAERLNQSTFSSACVPDAAYRNYNQEGLFEAHGFSDDKVTGDVRFKLVQALHGSGLQHSQYAHALIRSMESATLASKNLHCSKLD